MRPGRAALAADSADRGAVTTFRRRRE